MAADALELEHVIGWTGAFPGTLQCMPTATTGSGAGGSAETAFVCALGAHVVVAALDDPHAQVFLRAHDATVSAISVSRTARLLASGQVRSPTSAVSRRVAASRESTQSSCDNNPFGYHPPTNSTANSAILCLSLDAATNLSSGNIVCRRATRL